MKHLAIILLSLFASAFAWSQTPLPLAWVPAGSNNLEANLDVSPTVTLSPTTTVMAAGYYAATNLAEVDPDLAAENIASNVTVFGIAGTLNTNIVALIPRTGQTNSFAAEDDGALKTGVAWPNPRFTVQANTNCVLDNLTGLIWARNANQFGQTNWGTCVTNCNNMDYGGQTDWRLPNKRELMSLIDENKYNPALPTGHPFIGVQSLYYWSSTTYMDNTASAWAVSLINGRVYEYSKTITAYVWPVRGGL